MTIHYDVEVEIITILDDIEEPSLQGNTYYKELNNGNIEIIDDYDDDNDDSPSEFQALSGQKRTHSSVSSSSASSTGSAGPTQQKKGKNLSTLSPTSNTSSDFILVTLSCSRQQEGDAITSRPVKALLDTGNHASDFIASWVIDSLDLGAYVRESNSTTVCSGLDNACYDTSKSIRLFVSYFNELTNKYDVLDIDAVLLDTSSIDMIISKSTIIKYDLFRTIPSQFFRLKPISEVPCTSACGIVSCGCLPIKASRTLKRLPKGILCNPDTILTSSPKRGMFSMLIRESERLATVSLPDEDEIDHVKTDTFAPWLPQNLRFFCRFLFCIFFGQDSHRSDGSYN